MKSEQIENLKKTRQKCVGHAKDLLNSAKILHSKGYANIAYHLATLALEEIGKIIMLTAGFASSKRGGNIIKQAGEDHVKKLFWALWGPSASKEKITKEQIEKFIDLAKNIHKYRLSGLYVSIDLENQTSPKDSIDENKLKTLINIAEARLGMEENSDIQEPDEQTQADLEWFQNAAYDPYKKNLMFGQKALAKLHELGRTNEWIRWMRQQFEIAEKESIELLQKELHKPEPSEKEKTEKKWQVRFKLITPSHSIREKVLNEWNSHINIIKLALGKRTPRTCELIIDMIFPKSVRIETLWYAAWWGARLFAISLNIATKGYFWWYLPKDTSKFYEKIRDLEHNTDVAVEMKPNLRLNWGNNVLSRTELNYAVICYRFLPKDNVDFLNAYVTGISLMGKSDIHTPFEEEIFMQFFHALLYAMKFYEDCKDEQSFETTFESIFKPLVENPSDMKEYIQLAEELKRDKKSKRKITLDECGIMKILFDVYVLSKINLQAVADKRKEARSDITKKTEAAGTGLGIETNHEEHK